MKPCKVKFVKAIIDQYEWQQPMQIKLSECSLHLDIKTII